MKNQVNVKLLKAKIAEFKTSKTAFAKECNISYQTLKKILCGQDNIKILSLFKIARKLNINVHELFDK